MRRLTRPVSAVLAYVQPIIHSTASPLSVAASSVTSYADFGQLRLRLRKIKFYKCITRNLCPRFFSRRKRRANPLHADRTLNLRSPWRDPVGGTSMHMSGARPIAAIIMHDKCTRAGMAMHASIWIKRSTESTHACNPETLYATCTMQLSLQMLNTL